LSFHLSNISLLASSIAKAIMFLPCRVGHKSCGATPNIAIMARGSMGVPSRSEKNLNIGCQNSVNFGQNQNICDKVAVAVRQRSQLGSIFGVIFANLALDQSNLCTILNCITLCLKQIEDECILSNVESHISSVNSMPNSSSHWLFKCVKVSKL